MSWMRVVVLIWIQRSCNRGHRVDNVSKDLKVVRHALKEHGVPRWTHLGGGARWPGGRYPSRSGGKCMTAGRIHVETGEVTESEHRSVRCWG